VFAFIVTVALVNLLVGFGAALVVSHDWPTLRSRFLSLRREKAAKAGPGSSAPGSKDPQAAPSNADPAAEKSSAPGAAPPDAAFANDIPALWREQLLKSDLPGDDLLEAACLLVRAHETAFGQRLAELERRLRVSLQQNAESPTRQSLTQLAEESTASLAHTDSLREGLESLPSDRRQAAQGLEAAIEAAQEAKQRLQTLVAELLRSPRVVSQGNVVIERLLEAHEKSRHLYDQALEMLACSLDAAEQAKPVPAAWRKDNTTPLASRLELNHALRTWRQQDPGGRRILSAALVHLDQMNEINQGLGILRANALFAEFAKLAEGTIRVDRGDCLVRIAGPTVFLLLADTDIAGALSAIERLRQTVEQSTFKAGHNELRLRADCAVCELMLEDRPTDLLQRLGAGIAEVKQAGRNRTALDEGQGPVVVDPISMEVQGRVVNIA
jgi:GGDEF domain-containing protein